MNVDYEIFKKEKISSIIKEKRDELNSNLLKAKKEFNYNLFLDNNYSPNLPFDPEIVECNESYIDEDLFTKPKIKEKKYNDEIIVMY